MLMRFHLGFGVGHRQPPPSTQTYDQTDDEADVWSDADVYLGEIQTNRRKAAGIKLSSNNTSDYLDGGLENPELIAQFGLEEHKNKYLEGSSSDEGAEEVYNSKEECLIELDGDDMFL